MASAADSAAARSVVSGYTHLPEHAGQCFESKVAWVGERLGEASRGAPYSGSAIRLDDGHYMVDYDQVRAIDRSRVGDRVRLCVAHLPPPSCPSSEPRGENCCPPGDTRGITYRGHNLRTGLSWTAGDSEHLCGGA